MATQRDHHQGSLLLVEKLLGKFPQGVEDQRHLSYLLNQDTIFDPQDVIGPFG